MRSAERACWLRSAIAGYAGCNGTRPIAKVLQEPRSAPRGESQAAAWQNSREYLLPIGVSASLILLLHGLPLSGGVFYVGMNASPSVVGFLLYRRTTAVVIAFALGPLTRMSNGLASHTHALLIW